MEAHRPGKDGHSSLNRRGVRSGWQAACKVTQANSRKRLLHTTMVLLCEAMLTILTVFRASLTPFIWTPRIDCTMDQCD